jgi:hypothetical protein
MQRTMRDARSPDAGLWIGFQVRDEMYVPSQHFARQQRQSLHMSLPAPPHSKAAMDAAKLLNVSSKNKFMLGWSFFPCVPHWDCHHFIVGLRIFALVRPCKHTYASLFDPPPPHLMRHTAIVTLPFFSSTVSFPYFDYIEYASQKGSQTKQQNPRHDGCWLSNTQPMRIMHVYAMPTDAHSSSCTYFCSSSSSPCHPT